MFLMIRNFENILIKKKPPFRDSIRFDYLLKSIEFRLSKPCIELKQKELQEEQLEVIIL